ncbi:MAG: hypothetical protein ABJX32_07025 [Tateyamaria sp.]|uniref:hypothetical protein n=1 Tax=Tateyamaria sp. TaxID=1929288 RepID=UPI00329B2DBE
MGTPAHPHTIAGKAGFQRIEGIGTVSAVRTKPPFALVGTGDRSADGTAIGSIVYQ